VVEVLRKQAPEVRHLVVTCNAQGRLAGYGREPGVLAITLDDRTNDRSLVMTSSFTNMVLAGRILGLLGDPLRYVQMVHVLAHAGETLLKQYGGALAAVGRRSFRRVVYLGDGCRFGAARECALKMMEMTDGRVVTMAETYLGLRHGPMCAIGEDTLVVCFLASDPVVRAYESDVIAEMNRKSLGATKLILGETPEGVGSEADAVLDIRGYHEAGDHGSAVLDVVAGQLLAFFRCLEEGLSPDAPSASGVISRVVGAFVMHGSANNAH
jgi:tagatose-6-phosphate ketose/aldose isomerase